MLSRVAWTEQDVSAAENSGAGGKFTTS
ncbi:uncharacterized, partial [Tachysurus ichikawai]